VEGQFGEKGEWEHGFKKIANGTTGRTVVCYSSADNDSWSVYNSCTSVINFYLAAIGYFFKKSKERHFVVYFYLNVRNFMLTI
jgi:hypothetical protein